MRFTQMLTGLAIIGFATASAAQPYYYDQGNPGGYPQPPVVQQQPGGMAGVEVRLSDLENQIRQLTGQVEQQNYTIQQLQQQLQTAKAAPAPTPPVASPPPANTPLPGSPLPDAAPQASLPSDPDGLYNAAFGRLKNADYEGSAEGFRQFLSKNSAHPLAGNAQYWLGETYYVRKQYAEAATEFLAGYQKYPKNSKAPDNLLKLGLSLEALNSKDQACQTFSRLLSEYPSAARVVQQRASAERTRLACKS